VPQGEARRGGHKECGEVNDTEVASEGGANYSAVASSNFNGSGQPAT